MAGGLNTSPAVLLSGATDDEEEGYAVGAAGDTDGDGFPDVLAGSAYYEYDLGTASLHRGGPEGVDETRAVTWEGASTELRGHGLAGVGDVDGDGFGDALLGSPYYLVSDGLIGVYSGSARGLGDVPTQVLTGGEYDAVGYALVAAGDVNGDGFADAVGLTEGIEDGGCAHSYLGSPGGLVAGVTVAALGNHAYLAAAAGGRDLDGDGFDDLVVGFPRDDTAHGTIEVFPGSTYSMTVEPAQTVTGLARGRLGGALALGDFDGDGFADILAAATDASGGAGEVVVLWGGPSGVDPFMTTTITGHHAADRLGRCLAAADFDGDGYDDAAISTDGGEDEGGVLVYRGSATGLETTASARVRWPDGVSPYECAVDAHGDVDGDGLADLLVGGSQVRRPGRAALYLGSMSGISTTAAWTGTDHEPGASFGARVSLGSDVDGDGCADALVAAPEAGDGAGAVYLYRGCSARDDVDGDGVATDVDCDDADPETGGPSGWLEDDDADGYGGSFVVACEAPVGAAAAGGDCDDADPAIHPGAEEVCDGRDDDCDGTIDIDAVDATPRYRAADGDGWGLLPGRLLCEALPGTAIAPGDCDDSDPTVHPKATDAPRDGVDQDCDGHDGT